MKHYLDEGPAWKSRRNRLRSGRSQRSSLLRHDPRRWRQHRVRDRAGYLDLKTAGEQGLISGKYLVRPEGSSSTQRSVPR